MTSSFLVFFYFIDSLLSSASSTLVSCSFKFYWVALLSNPSLLSSYVSSVWNDTPWLLFEWLILFSSSYRIGSAPDTYYSNCIKARFSCSSSLIWSLSSKLFFFEKDVTVCWDYSALLGVISSYYSLACEDFFLFAEDGESFFT